MKKTLAFLILICFSFIVQAQDTTKILFIGNSFTDANYLYQIVKNFYLADGLPAYTYAYAPGGVSVGDTAQGNMAHMNNPAVFDLIRNNDWDALVLQDNQGRFVHDSAKFPASSLVIQGHLRIRDSLQFYHPCAKMIWFSGWGLKNGQLPNWPTGINMIDSITVNYRVLNDTAKDVIAPIGLAWKNVILNYPSIDLWISDMMHPSESGSYLTAAIIYGTIEEVNPAQNTFNFTLTPANAAILKSVAQETLSDTAIFRKSNLKGIESVGISYTYPELNGPAGMQLYRWYLGQNPVATTTSSAYTPVLSGKYRLWTRDNAGYWQKSCALEVSIPNAQTEVAGNQLKIYPNPASDYLIISEFPENHGSVAVFISNLDGSIVIKQNITTNSDNRINIQPLKPGMYFIDLQGYSVDYRTKFLKIK